MGAAAAVADHIVVTSDNPRSEEPASIVAMVASGVPAGRRCERIVDRAQAIAFALAQADARDVVLIAGKGHEDYQDIAGHKRHFSDVEQAQAALARRRGEPPPSGAGDTPPASSPVSPLAGASRPAGLAC
jgi:UDP-N-acetylmuramoyl-L-alanyl-D-glutamate--2,6-diaminopimelate ligase